MPCPVVSGRERDGSLCHRYTPRSRSVMGTVCASKSPNTSQFGGFLEDKLGHSRIQIRATEGRSWAVRGNARRLPYRRWAQRPPGAHAKGDDPAAALESHGHVEA
jgi:hypothetical protein